MTWLVRSERMSGNGLIQLLGILIESDEQKREL